SNPETAMIPQARDARHRGGARRLLAAGFEHLWKRISDRSIQCFRGNRCGGLEVDFQEVKEQPMFAETLPFRQVELRYELLVGLVVWHRAGQGCNKPVKIATEKVTTDR